MRKIWGFDLGVTSIGFAVVYEDGSGTSNGGKPIERLGVRIFPESRENENKDRAPKNAARRQARLGRRQTRRRRWRRVHLREVLAKAGLLANGKAEPPAGQDPYGLRARGLGDALAQEELGWALFHLLKRRGFSGSRKHGDKRDDKATKDDEESRTKAASLVGRLEGRQLGEYLARIENTVEAPQRRRGVGQTRDMVTSELDALWQAQLRYHPDLLTADLREQIEHVALWQRPTYFRRRSIGHCDLEPTQERALKADWLTQHFETLQLVNGLRLEAGNQRGLDAGERELALAYLQATARPTWAGLRRAVALPRDARFTHERGKKETVRGNATEAALRRALGADFPMHPLAQPIRDAIGAAWHLIEYEPARSGSILEIRDHKEIAAERARLTKRALAEWGLDPEAADRLAAVELPDGTGRHSLAAMRKLLPRLEAGQPYTAALRGVYTVQESGKPLAFLPGPNLSEVKKAKGVYSDPYVQARMESLLGSLRNPTVLRTLGELQKVVNTLIRVYGKPDLIRLEMARELKQSAKERALTDKYQMDREKARNAARAKVRELGRPAEGKEGEDNVLRILLWQEQGGRCPFTGDHIGCAEALSAAATEIEHVFPRSRSLDDSQANKVLCGMQANRAKGSRTPFEWLSVQPSQWLHLTETVWPQMRASGWPEAKLRRCLRQDFEDAEGEGFTSRQLIDTSYIARAARDYLGLLFGGGQVGIDAVQVVPGRATAQLRRAWSIGLNRLLHGDVSDGPKTRDDHRHHAIDALAVALTSPASVKRLSSWWQVRETQAARPQFQPPWEGFHVQAKAAVEAIVVSHRVQAKLSGALHREKPLGDTGETRGEYKLYVKRKPIAEITARNVEAIRDEAVKGAIQDAIKAAGGNLKRGLAGEIRLPRKDGTPGPVIRRVRLLIPHSEGVMPLHATKNIHAELGPGSLAWMEIFEDEGTVSFRVVTCRDAAFKARNRREEVSGQKAQKLIMILRQNDVVCRQINAKDEYRRIVKFNSAGQIFFRPVAISTVERSDLSRRPGPLISEGWRKVSVDAIGRVLPSR